MKRVGVTGAAGFIGSHLCKRLLGEGVEVVGVDDLSCGAMVNLAACLENPRFPFERARLHPAPRASRGVRRMRRDRPSGRQEDPAVRRRAGDARGERGRRERGLRRRRCRSTPTSIIASTSDVYGNATPPFAEDGDAHARPADDPPLGVRRLEALRRARRPGAGRGARACGSRSCGCSASYGPHNHPSWWGGPQSAFIEALLDGETMEIHGDGQQTRTFTYVDDTVDGFVRALRRPPREAK